MNELLTDNEIMKNVRCCADNYCKNCSLQGKPNCKNTLFSLAWNTLYDLKSENDILKKKYEFAVSEREANVKGFTETLNTIKDETRKELGEQIKMAFYYHFDEIIPSVMADKIDELVRGCGKEV